MRGPGTTAAAAGAAGFEADPASGAVTAGRQPAVPVAPPPTVATQVTALETSRVVAPVTGATRELPCMDDPDLFFAESPEDVECAKAICGGCPARAACLSGALDRHEPWGVWGGELLLRGEVVPRKRPRWRPRKTEIAA